MLVGPFEIEIGRAAQFGPFVRFEHEGVRRSGIEPHIEDVGHHLVIVRVTIRAEEFGGAGVVPGVDSADADGNLDARIDVRIDQQFAAFAVYK